MKPVRAQGSLIVWHYRPIHNWSNQTLCNSQVRLRAVALRPELAFGLHSGVYLTQMLAFLGMNCVALVALIGH